MQKISMRLPDEVLAAADRLSLTLGVSRAEYVRRAIEMMNRETRLQVRAQRLAEVSGRVRGDSMRGNAELAAVERDPEV